MINCPFPVVPEYPHDSENLGYSPHFVLKLRIMFKKVVAKKTGFVCHKMDNRGTI